MKNLFIPVVYGSYRETRQGIKAARFAVSELEAICNTKLIDAKELGFELLDKRLGDYDSGQAPEFMRQTSEDFNRADAIVWVTGEYNHGFVPGLKNLMDHFHKEFAYKPSGIVSYSAGSFAGARAADHLRVVLAQLAMPPTARVMTVSSVGSSFQDDGTPLDEKLKPRFEKFCSELIWYAEALKPAREKGT
ncbi:MAG: NAD(P)H-dependent oxidoreductase, partial [Flavobacteriales bacterium]|nr:NAD(P)H-dependent oxidoreductase [Flavobacteriales bacterium]